MTDTHLELKVPTCAYRMDSSQSRFGPGESEGKIETNIEPRKRNMLTVFIALFSISYRVYTSERILCN